MSWIGVGASADRERALDPLESGKVVFLPGLAFEFAPGERRFLDPACSDGKAKNISFDPSTGAVCGAALGGGDRTALRQLLVRFGTGARTLVCGLFPRYAPHLELGRASLRPVAIDGRRMSPRKDARRLHVDAFPSRPVQGRRILRVFVNVDPRGAARVWQVGEAFADYARHFLPRRSWAMPGTARLLEALAITKGRRTPYDRLMLCLHDRAKAD
ncbi:MAG: Kdo hydroxylase family protein, partial [Alphaproteobacteria bacterium]|nr:Kdo hydroxylase family protein [Alphaproteobacteria bacterium]